MIYHDHITPAEEKYFNKLLITDIKKILNRTHAEEESLSHIIAELKLEGWKNISSWISRDYLDAIDFFESIGFKVTKYFRDNGNRYKTTLKLTK